MQSPDRMRSGPYAYVLGAATAAQIKRQISARSKIDGVGQRVEAKSVRAVIIVAAAADRHEAGGAIHCDRRIAVAHFKMDSGGPASPGPVEEIVEQARANALPVVAREHREQEKLGFVRDAAE